MSKHFIIIMALVFTFQAKSQVKFKDQSIRNTIVQAKQDQKLIMSVCSSESCPPCRWMEAHVYPDPQLSKIINENLIPLNTSVANIDRLENMQYCQSLPSFLFFNENGKLVHKETGKKTIAELQTIVTRVLAANCTELDEKLDPTQGTSKNSNCCKGLVADKEQKCIKRQCVENSELGIHFDGDAREALNCCEDSAEKRVIMKIKGHIVHCMDQETFKEINDRRREDIRPIHRREIDVLDSGSTQQ
jgi:thioredoxin-related protein